MGSIRAREPDYLVIWIVSNFVKALKCFIERRDVILVNLHDWMLTETQAVVPSGEDLAAAHLFHNVFICQAADIWSGIDVYRHFSDAPAAISQLDDGALIVVE